jgi:hypothetical protein
MFNPLADPTEIAARAGELAIEQLDRLNDFIKNNPTKDPGEFYKIPFEIGVSNNIARLMAAYAVLKDYVSIERVTRK